MRAFSYSMDTADAVIYENINGVASVIQDPATVKTVKKTIWQDDNIPLITLGDTFMSAGIAAVCTKITVSDAVDAINGADVLRRWKVEYEGVTNLGGTYASEFKMERQVSYDLNGASEISVDGETVVLLRSATPRKVTRIVCYGSSPTPPVLPGSTYESGVCTKSTSSIVTVEKSGFKLAQFYKYDIEVVD